jgi:hypothetical protein
MNLTRAYLTSFKNLKPILEAVQMAQAPPKFTTRFLEGLGFKSPPDRLVIGVLKGLGFLTGSGEPTKRYFEFLDQTQSARVLAEGIREAYGDLFQINTKAQDLTITDVKNKLKTLTQGQVSDSVLDKMAGTFKNLSQLADFTTAPQKPKEEPEENEAEQVIAPEASIGKAKPLNIDGLVFNIQIVLPESRDAAVYDALFKSLKDHLVS